MKNHLVEVLPLSFVIVYLLIYLFIHRVLKGISTQLPVHITWIPFTILEKNNSH